MVFVVVLLVICGFVGGMIGTGKGRTLLGFALGVTVIGLVAIAVLPPSSRRATPWQQSRKGYGVCPWCRGRLTPGAERCGHCYQRVMRTAPTPVGARRR